MANIIYRKQTKLTVNDADNLIALFNNLLLIDHTDDKKPIESTIKRRDATYSLSFRMPLRYTTLTFIHSDIYRSRGGRTKRPHHSTTALTRIPPTLVICLRVCGWRNVGGTVCCLTLLDCITLEVGRSVVAVFSYSAWIHRYQLSIHVMSIITFADVFVRATCNVTFIRYHLSAKYTHISGARSNLS